MNDRNPNFLGVFGITQEYANPVAIENTTFFENN